MKFFWYVCGQQALTILCIFTCLQSNFAVKLCSIRISTYMQRYVLS